MAKGEKDEVRVTIDAPVEVVWSLVSDVSRMGEWSPECYRTVWLGGATGPALGARFRGDNRQRWVRWSVPALITAFEEHRLFQFTTVMTGRLRNRWSYRLTPTASGTELVETYEGLSDALLAKVAYRTVLRDRRASRIAGMQRTLERIKAVAESEWASHPGERRELTGRSATAADVGVPPQPSV